MSYKNLLFFNKKGDQYNLSWNGSHWEGSVLFPKVSEELFEIEHIFILEKFYNLSMNTVYGFPHNTPSVPSTSNWRVRWESDYDGKIDVTDTIFTYDLSIDPNLDAPVLNNVDAINIYPDEDLSETFSSPDGIRITGYINSTAAQVNVALRSSTEGIYDRRLILEDVSDPSDIKKILVMDFHGEVEGEDDRFSVLLGNFGRKFTAEDSKLLRETDPKEGYPDWLKVNEKRKELLLEGDKIYSYLGSYKSLINAIRFFGYYDLRIKEYWLNLKADADETLTPLQQNQNFIDKYSNQKSVQTIENVLADENHKKYKQIEIYGKRKDGTYGIKEKYEEIFPSVSYKKTSLFGLFYDINREKEDGSEDRYGYPVVEDAFMFSPEEVLLKLFGLKERLKRDYLPLNARIIDITGEGVYFGIYKTRAWSDQLQINDVKLGIEVKFDIQPKNGYIEDLRPFYLRNNPNIFQYPVVDGLPETPELSHYGNIIEPYSSFQEYQYPSITSLSDAIKKFYADIEYGKMPKFLGDGDYDPPGYKLFKNGNDYVFPAGCPIVLTNTTFDLSWNDMGGDWDGLNPVYPATSLNVASYTSTVSPNPGYPLSIQSSSTTVTIPTVTPSMQTFYIPTGQNYFSTVGSEVLFIRIQNQSGTEFMLGYVISGGYNTLTGQLDINIIYTSGSGTFSTWKVIPVNVFDNVYIFNWYQNFANPGGSYSWDRIKYLDFYEIEWTISKSDDRPYYFSYRGKIDELEVVPHFLPYTGTYDIQCRVWDTLNSISLGIQKSAIEIKSRDIELNTITRYRESEKYDWDNTVLSWSDYESQWIWPVEHKEKTQDLSTFINNFPEYSNNFNEGQNCEILTKKPEVKANVSFDFTVITYSIVQISSPSPGTLAQVQTTTPHGYSANQNVWIYDSLGNPYGLFPIISIVNPTTFEIPQILSSVISGGTVIGDGNITIQADGVEIVNVNFNGSLTSVSALIYQAINGLVTYPDYTVYSLTSSTTNIGANTLVINAPDDTGSTWNGKLLSITTSGCMFSYSSSVPFSGGSNEKEEYIAYDFTTAPPTPSAALWGTKKIAWDAFEDFEFDKAYSQTWDMYDYHNDWLGGFNLYSLQYGDKIKVGKDTEGIILGEKDSPPNSYLDLKEAADQLNTSTDPGISKFEYVVRNYSELPFNFGISGNSISPDLSTTPGPRNVGYSHFTVPFATASPSLGNPVSLAWDLNGDVWISGSDLVSFDGLNMNPYNSTNSPLPSNGLTTSFIEITENGGRFIGIKGTGTPLVYWNERDLSLNNVYTISDFADNQGNTVLTSSIVDFNLMEENPSTNDLFIACTEYVSPDQNGLLFYCASENSWRLYTTLNSDLPSGNIRDLRIRYYSDNEWYLWIATDNGVARFDGIDFRIYNTGNSGLSDNDVYSIELDKLGHIWFGTMNNLVYYDYNRWSVWNNGTNPDLFPGAIIDIVETNNANIWFILDGGSPSNRMLYYFNGYNFTKYEYKADGITPLNPIKLMAAPWKTIKNGFTVFPMNIVYLSDTELNFVDYIVPHIHALPKFPGADGYQFIYHEPKGILPSLTNGSTLGDGYGNLSFNWSPGPLYDNITLNSDGIRPDLPNVDRYSWSKPIWQRYSVNNLKNRFPSLNLDHTFLYAPLRDIINGKATNEYYWKNLPIERISSKKKNLLISDVEWIISMGDISNDYLFSSIVDREGDVIVTGGYTGTVFAGEVNNIATQNVYLTSGNSGVNQSGIVLKYNSSGVLQWARSIDNISQNVSIFSVKTDLFCNIYVTGFYTDTISLNNEYVFINKYSTDGNLLSSGIVSTIGTGQIQSFDIELDKFGNIYISGRFSGTITLGSQTFTTSSVSVFVSKIDEILNFVWTDTFDTSFAGTDDMVIMQDIFIYLTGSYTGSIDFDGNVLTSSGSDVYFSKLDAGTGAVLWSKNFGASTAGDSKIVMDPKGHLILTGTYSGTIASDGNSISSPTSSLYLMKFTPTGKSIWMKTTSGSLTYGYAAISDSEEYIYVTGVYTGPTTFSPSTANSFGNDDIFIGKWDKDGVLIDLVTMGGISMDSGNALSLDKNENLYLSGYFTGSNTQFSPFVASSPQPGGTEGFLLKIPKKRYYTGLAIGNVSSWLGSHSWSWKESKVFKNEFEIPIASTIFINPIDSLIPGKKNHVWTLIDTGTGDILLKVRKTPYFIYTFIKEGFYDVSCELEDANGNPVSIVHSGKIRVIDHKSPDAEDLIPATVNSLDYRYRSIYGNQMENQDAFEASVEIMI